MHERLQPCPDKPNCVCSLATDKRHRIAAIAFQGGTARAQALMRTLILSMPRTRIVEEQPGYLHFTATSWLFRFVDDIEMVFDPIDQHIEIRSASRKGYSDLGVNRKRVEKLRRMFRQADREKS